MGIERRFLTWKKGDKLFDLFDRCGYRKKIPRLVSLGLLKMEDMTLQFTPKGRLFENEICRMLYSPIVDAETRGQRWRAFWKWFWDDAHKHRPIPRA